MVNLLHSLELLDPPAASQLCFHQQLQSHRHAHNVNVLVIGVLLAVRCRLVANRAARLQCRQGGCTSAHLQQCLAAVPGAWGTMGAKRERSGKPKDEEAPAPPAKATVGQQTSHIKNKLVRAELYAKLKHKKKKAQKQERVKRQKEAEKAEELGLEPPPKKKQKTLENTREADVTMVLAGDEEVAAEEEQDEFAEHFQRVREPKVLITTCYKPSKLMYAFISELLETLPCAEYYKRQGFPLKKIVGFGAKRDYSDLLVFNEDNKEINGLLHVHLPEGPTAHYRLSNLRLGRDIKGHGRASSHRPELILNGFNTRLGRRVGRMLGSLFHQDPAFRGRRVVTFHNQRDFVFFRHHRYIFEEKERKVKEAGAKAPVKKEVVKARLQELGPRFTLRLQSLQKGTFDSKQGEFEWVHKTDMDTSRRRFHL